MDVLARLEDWKNGGHGKGRELSIWHDNSYGATDGWNVELKNGPREVHVTGWKIMEAADIDEWPTLETVIAAALDEWEKVTPQTT